MSHGASSGADTRKRTSLLHQDRLRFQKSTSMSAVFSDFVEVPKERRLLPLGDAQKFYPDCCLGLSYDTLEAISVALRWPSGLILSIGSGSGFLERHLQQHNTDLEIEGVEVPMTNAYLPEESINVVSGTWALSDRAAVAATWMFVYPRSPDLISKYLEKYASSSLRVRRIIWIGPAVDWTDGGFAESLQHGGFEARSDAVCLSQSERMVIIDRKDAHG